MRTIFWKRGKGELIALEDMKDNHLISSFLLFEKSSIERWYKWEATGGTDSYTGGYGIDMEGWDGVVFGPKDFLERDVLYQEMRKEIIRRGMGLMFFFRDRKIETEEYW